MEKTKKEIKKKFQFRSYPTGYRKFEKNNKKTRKLKNTIMASFQAKIGWKRLRKKGNKNYISVTFLPDVLEKIPKKSKNIKKYTIMASFQAKIAWKRQREREKIKNIVPFRSYPA